ncbi:hypothetical protein DSO57_1003101 [Entomophthora muscae]|uniref:Uncharacterized protein n=1 Tax=Entomophthora muscae TaxID=34485 RepID=A0ACC2UTZ1_9FUNG|nr:hypothetical protein DSO57_1003101 [Entomophthora muscae]
MNPILRLGFPVVCLCCASEHNSTAEAHGGLVVSLHNGLIAVIDGGTTTYRDPLADMGFEPIDDQGQKHDISVCDDLGAAARACCQAARYSGTDPVCLIARRGVLTTIGKNVSL